jgi:hypothetical protein
VITVAAAPAVAAPRRVLTSSSKTTTVATAAAPVSAFAGKSSQQPTHVFVKDVPPKMALSALTKHFSQFGPVWWRQRHTSTDVSMAFQLYSHSNCLFVFFLGDFLPR